MSENEANRPRPRRLASRFLASHHDAKVTANARTASPSNSPSNRGEFASQKSKTKPTSLDQNFNVHQNLGSAVTKKRRTRRGLARRADGLVNGDRVARPSPLKSQNEANHPITQPRSIQDIRSLLAALPAHASRPAERSLVCRHGRGILTMGLRLPVRGSPTRGLLNPFPRLRDFRDVKERLTR